MHGQTWFVAEVFSPISGMVIPDFASYLRRFSFKCQILGEILFEIIVKIGIESSLAAAYQIDI